MSYWRSNEPHLIVLLIVACAVLAVVQVVERLWPLVLLGLVAVVVWRGRLWRILRGHTKTNDLRRQVAKLERDAERHDQLVGDLEDAAGRPVEAIIASYRHLQRSYKTTVPRKTEIGV